MALNILLSSSKSGAPWYEAALTACGAVPHSVFCPQVDLNYDGLLLCGGDDVDPARFGQENAGSKGIIPERDEAELALIRAYMDAGKPILAICRGHQILNVALGGALIQDLPDQVRPFHCWDVEEHDKVHPIRALPDSLLGTMYGPLFHVNSAHHQAVGVLGRDLIPTAWSEGGVVEAMEHPSLPILCVQFHPERICFARARTDTVDGAPIFRWFLDQCAKQAE